MEWINEYPVVFICLALLLGALLSAWMISLSVKRIQRSTRGRILELERHIAQQQTGMAESMRSVMQMSASASRGAEERADQISEKIDARLERMQRTVDEQLTGMLDKRLSQSFQQVSAQLEQVYKGLGEMRSLAGGVGDLKKILQGVKTRGIWGEVQLGALLSQMLSPAQFAENVEIVRGAQERVEFCVVLPGQGAEPLLLPIDSKFPLDAFSRLIEASESGDKTSVQQAGALLQRAVLEQAKKISEKYIRPPRTVDFAIMFLPAESLYAEIVRRDGLAELMQTKYRVLVAGPTTLAALLNSLQLGFRTLTIEQRTGEVWQLLASVKNDFQRFTESLEKMRVRLDQTSAELDAATARGRAITRRLDDLERYDERANRPAGPSA